MKVNQINQTNNRQSFGMAFSPNEKSFAKVDPEQIKFVKDIIDATGQSVLDRASDYTKSSLIAEKAENGKISSVIIGAMPDGLRELYKEIGILLIDVLKRKKVNDTIYAKRINIEDLTPETLLDAVKTTSGAVLGKHGSKKRAKDILDGDGFVI